MGKRLLTLSLCALGVAGLASTGTASAATGNGGSYQQVQIFDANGLNRTVDCPTNTAAPECDEHQLQIQIGMSLGTPNGAIVGYRHLNAAGRKVLEVANNDASLSVIEEYDRVNGGPAWEALQSSDASAQAAKKANTKANKKAGKKAGKHKKGYTK